VTLTPLAILVVGLILQSSMSTAMEDAAAPAPLSRAEAACSLIGRDLSISRGLLVELSGREIVFRHADGRLTHQPLADGLAVLTGHALQAPPRLGLLRLADGQELPGQSVSSSPDREVLVWNHALLGRLLVPVKDIDSILFATGGADAQRGLPAQGDLDVVLLANGDRLEGFILSLAGPIVLELAEGGATAEIALDRVAAVRLVTPRRPPVGQRVWLTDGSVIDVKQVSVSDDRTVRLIDPAAAGASTIQSTLSDVAGVLLDAASLRPFAAIGPVRVEGPPTRYVVPAPEVGEVRAAPLGLAGVTYRGPLKVWYTLPAGSTRFAAEARLPDDALQWGDCELLIHDGGREAFRARLNLDQPVALINIELRTDELAIEIAEGANGPVQDHVALHRAMVLVTLPAAH
jgi:hypothetical protein